MNKTSLTYRRWRSWAKDAAERAVKTVAQTVVATVAVTEGLTLDAFYDLEVWSIGAAAGVVSLLTSLASKRVGYPDSAGLDV